MQIFICNLLSYFNNIITVGEYIFTIGEYMDIFIARKHNVNSLYNIFVVGKHNIMWVNIWRDYNIIWYNFNIITCDIIILEVCIEYTQLVLIVYKYVI